MSRVRRPELPPLPALTERDHALLAQLAEHEPLATSDLLLLFFTGARTCRVRLAQLEQQQLLVRVYPTAGRKGTSEALWFLTAEARALLGVPTRRAPSLSLPDLDHRRAVARFICQLVERSLQRPGEGLWRLRSTSWQMKRATARRWSRSGRESDGARRVGTPRRARASAN